MKSSIWPRSFLTSPLSVLKQNGHTHNKNIIIYTRIVTCFGYMFQDCNQVPGHTCDAQWNIDFDYAFKQIIVDPPFPPSHIYAYIYNYMQIVHVCVCVCLYVCLSLSLRVSVCVCVCVWVNMYACAHVSINVHLHAWRTKISNVPQVGSGNLRRSVREYNWRGVTWYTSLVCRIISPGQPPNHHYSTIHM